MKHLFVAAFLVLAFVPLAHSQAPLKGTQKKPQRKAETEIKVFSLQNSEAAAAVNAIVGIMQGVKASSDPRTNSVIVTGTKEELAIVEALLLRLDESKSQKKTDTQVKVFYMRNSAADAQRLLQQLVGRGVNMVVDGRKNSLFVSGDANQLEQIEKLLEVIDKPTPRVPRVALKLRVVWLMTDADGKPPTKDLQKVVESLSKIGIDGLTVVSQSLINVGEPGSDFDVSGTVGEEERMFRISGESGERVDVGPMRFDLSIEAQPKGQKRAAEVRAAVSLDDGQTAVLGVTQTRTANSVFVVQLIEGL